MANGNGRKWQVVGGLSGVAVLTLVWTTVGAPGMAKLSDTVREHDRDISSIREQLRTVDRMCGQLDQIGLEIGAIKVSVAKLPTREELALVREELRELERHEVRR